MRRKEIIISSERDFSRKSSLTVSLPAATQPLQDRVCTWGTASFCSCTINYCYAITTVMIPDFFYFFFFREAVSLYQPIWVEAKKCIFCDNPLPPAWCHIPPALATSSSSVCQRRGARWLFRGWTGGLIPAPREQQAPPPPPRWAHKQLSARPAPGIPARCPRRSRGGTSPAPGSGMCPGQADTKPGKLPRRLPGQWQLPGWQLGTLHSFIHTQECCPRLGGLDFSLLGINFPPTEN